MKKLIVHTSFVMAILAIGIFWIGCSDDNIEVISSSSSGGDSSPVEYYFPLSQGYSVEYDIYTSDSQHELKLFTVGNEVELPTGNAVQWFSYSDQSGQDTGYFKSTSESLYYFDSPDAAPEKILSLPLVPGTNWLRTGDNTDLGTNITDGGNGDNQTDNTDGGVLSKNFPTVSGINMAVDKIESLQLDNGKYYSGVVSIVSDNGSGLYNRYWFAPGIGMIKYVLNTSAQNPDGSEFGEIRSYGSK